MYDIVIISYIETINNLIYVVLVMIVPLIGKIPLEIVIVRQIQIHLQKHLIRVQKWMMCFPKVIRI